MKNAAEADRWGIEPGYHDVFGVWHEIPARTRERLEAAISRNRTEPVGESDTGPARRAYQCRERKVWGIAMQLYALRSARNWGHGDFEDLAALIRIVAPMGCGAIGLNPLHALFLDRPENASPYSPNSRIFLNPLYIAVDTVPDCPDAAELGRKEILEELRAADVVGYPAVAALKRMALEVGYARFRKGADARRQHDFDVFRAEAGEPLLWFGAFEALRHRFGGAPWRQWPSVWRTPSRSAIVDLWNAATAEGDPEADPAYHAYLQWLAARQLQRCQEMAQRCGMAIGLFIDLAVGVDPAGADAWYGQDDMLMDVSIGAPPDEYNRAGQNWGLTTYNPQALIAVRGAPLRQMLDATMRYAGAIRIDHVLGLQRLYLIPYEVSANEGAYVRYPFETLLDVIVDESQRRRCVVIGEDLGTVPDGFREILKRRGIWSFQVMLFEREHDGGFRSPGSYQTEALATFSTHDLPTFAGWMSGHDLRTKRRLNIDPGEGDDARLVSRRRLAEAVRTVAGGERFDGAAAFLAQTPARLVMVALEDVLGMEDQVNIPGTVNEHPNWRRRPPVAVEALTQHDELRRIAAIFAQAGRSSDSAKT